MPKVLYTNHSHASIICERPNWKNCPEHKHLSEKRPKVDKFKDLNLEGFSSEESGAFSAEYYSAIGSSEKGYKEDPYDDPFYNPIDPTGKLRPNAGNACQKCGKKALAVDEVRGGLLKRKVTKVNLLCANCGYIQKSTVSEFL